MNKLFLITLLSLATTTLLMGTVHSDGTNVDDWQNYTGDGIIEPVDGAIRFTGGGLGSGYRLNLNDVEAGANTIKWRLKYQDAFTVYVDVNTYNGRRYLRYTQKTGDGGISPNGRTLRFGTGLGDGNSEWHNFSRNLVDDLRKFEPQNRLLSIRRFLIRGDVEIDDVETIKVLNQGSFRTLLSQKRERLIEQLDDFERYWTYWEVPEIIEDTPNIGFLRYTWVEDGHHIDQYYIYNPNSRTMKPFKAIEYEYSSVKNMNAFKDHGDGWTIRTVADHATIRKNGGRVELRGDDTNSAYQLKINDAREGANTVLLEGNSLRGMSIYVGMNTTKGYRYVRYSDRSNKEGLSTSGKTINIPNIPGFGYRNKRTHELAVEKMLLQYEPDNEFVSLDRIIIRGDADIKSVWSVVLDESY